MILVSFFFGCSLRSFLQFCPICCLIIEFSVSLQHYDYLIREEGTSCFILLGLKKRVREKSRECHNYKPQPFPDQRGKGNRQIQTSTNRTNVRKALRLALSSPSEVIAILKGLKNTRTKWHGKTYNKSPRRINHKATKSKTNTGTAALERSVEQTTGV